jgi:molybdenum cofactor synthesis domain-containing protein
LEIICVGNELLIGKVLNTNSQWLAKRATSLGVSVRRITVASDDIDEIAGVIQESLRRKPEFIITTGGLGPTFDDKTLGGIARALNRRLKIDEEALDMVRKKYENHVKERRMEKAELTPPRVKMATLPEGSRPISNPVGTAPGVVAYAEEACIIALPGVPPEMEAIFEESVVPLIRRKAGNAVFLEESVFADGVMESTLAPLVDEVMHDNPGIYVKSHPKGQEGRPHLELHLSTVVEDAQDGKARLRKAIGQLLELIEKSGGKTSSEAQC